MRVTKSTEQPQRAQTPEPVRTEPPSPTPEPTATPGPTETPEPESTTTVTPSPAEALDAIVRNSCRAGVLSVERDGGAVDIECKLADNLSESWITLGAFDTVYDISRDGFAADASVNQITLSMIGDFTDKLGAEFTAPAFTFVVTRALVEKVNFDNVSRRAFVALMADRIDGSMAGAHAVWRDTFTEELQK
jgi:hypothetical protein